MTVTLELHAKQAELQKLQSDHLSEAEMQMFILRRNDVSAQKRWLHNFLIPGSIVSVSLEPHDLRPAENKVRVNPCAHWDIGRWKTS